MAKSIISERLATIRRDQDVTQQGFADLLGIKRATYNKMESGANSITQEHMIKLHKVCRLSINWLLFGVGPAYLYPNQVYINLDFDSEEDKVNQMLKDMSENEGLKHAILGSYFLEKKRHDSKD